MNAGRPLRNSRRAARTGALVSASVIAGIAPARQPEPPAPPAPDSTPLVPAPARTGVSFPHPLITEVLYAVPTGGMGDANRDGVRDAAGDEFVELYNPHDRPIQLRGYRLRDRTPLDRSPFIFEFPACELAPGRVVVVFNGHKSTWRGPVGDTSRAPPAGNPMFHDALVFTAAADTPYVSFSNDGEWVLLSDPAGRPVQCVSWGVFDDSVPAAELVDRPADARGVSVQRQSPRTPMLPHNRLERFAGGDGLPYSPGIAAMAEDDAGPELRPAPSEER